MERPREAVLLPALLKGIGNVITGPGLVVLAGVFFKLFGQALKFTKESLTSLVGVTTEKQKQKAIQTSLVALFGQNAALNKEMLRTDIGRTEKEKIILGLLKAQVVEANCIKQIDCWHGWHIVSKRIWCKFDACW